MNSFLKGRRVMQHPSKSKNDTDSYMRHCGLFHIQTIQVALHLGRNGTCRQTSNMLLGQLGTTNPGTANRIDPGATS